MSKVVYIYGLQDPFTGLIRYVGKTSRTNLNIRLSEHICHANRLTNGHFANWLKKCIREGKRPKIVTLETCTEDTWAEREKAWIKHYKKTLTNILEGGKEPFQRKIGWHHSEETKRRMSEAQKGKPKNYKCGGDGKASRKPVIQRNLRGQAIKIWESAKEAADAIGIDPSAVTCSCKGKRIILGKFTFNYA